MSSTRPAVGVEELFSGDGPHRAIADRFVEGRCVECGGAVPRDGHESGEGWFCPQCWSTEQSRRA